MITHSPRLDFPSQPVKVLPLNIDVNRTSSSDLAITAGARRQTPTGFDRSEQLATDVESNILQPWYGLLD